MSLMKNFGADTVMDIKRLNEIVVDCLKERGSQSTTSIVRNTKLDKKIINSTIQRLRHQGIVIASSSKNGKSNGYTWCLARNKDSYEYKMMTRKWDLQVFS